MAEPRYSAAVAFALARLSNDLPLTYFYHNLAHTAEHVLPTAVAWAEASGCPDEEIELIRVAAAFHDIGIIEVRRYHELAGARLAAQVLPRFDLPDRAIDAVMGMIMATRIPQYPQTPLERILADADLDVLGRSDFLQRNAALRREVDLHEAQTNDYDWYRSQVAFVEEHTYFTAVARELRAAGKQANLERLRRRLRRARPGG